MLTEQALANASFVSLQQVLCQFLLLEPLGHSALPPRPLCGALLVLPPPSYPLGWHQVTPPPPPAPHPPLRPRPRCRPPQAAADSHA